jgi:hypothetical protein
MTGACADEPLGEFDWNRFDKACRYVSHTEDRPAQTALITGRGEPTLYPGHLGMIINRLDKVFPCIELQTNGILYKKLAWEEWKLYGLNTISISVASLDDTINNEAMEIKKGFSARDCIKTLAEMGFTLRVSYQLTLKDSPYYWNNNQVVKRCNARDWFYDTIMDAKSLGAQQITFRRVGLPEAITQNKEAYYWVKEFGDIHDYSEVFTGGGDPGLGKRHAGPLPALGKKISTYHWGGMIYDVNGMSVCIAECLTEDPSTFEPRSWIFDGRNLRYSWQYEGAIIF